MVANGRVVFAPPAARRYGPAARARSGRMGQQPAERIELSDIFDEIAEDLRAERWKRLAQRYGGLVVALCVVLVLGVGGWQGYGWYRARLEARLATAYLAAAAEAKPPAGGTDPAMLKKAIPAFETLIAEAAGPGWAAGWLANDGYRTLGRLQLAALRWDTGDQPAALALWDAVAADGRADPALRDTARLHWALHQLDAGDPAKVEAHLQPLLAPDNALRPLAEEARALLALRQGKTDDAKAGFKRLSADVTAPQGVRARAAGLLAQLGG